MQSPNTHKSTIARFELTFIRCVGIPRESRGRYPLKWLYVLAYKSTRKHQCRKNNKQAVRVTVIQNEYFRSELSGRKEKAIQSRVFVDDKRKVVRVSLDHVTVDTNLKALTLLSQCLGKHELTHPVNTVITVLDRKVVCLACAVNSFSRD